MKSIKKHLSLIILVFPLISCAQIVSNIHFEPAGKKILIYYDLEGDQEYTVQVFCSSDNGHAWGEPLQKVNGAVGENQKSGSNKIIVWDVLKETDNLTGEIKFNIVAELKFVQTKSNSFSGNSGTFFDERDGQEYKWVRIGSQIWMAENLNVGKRIHHKTEPTLNDVIEKYCYDNDETMCNKYGGLYSWNEAMQNTMHTDGIGICPDGWHIPLKEEWGDLIIVVDGALQSDEKELNKQRRKTEGIVGISASRYLKSKTHWKKNREGLDSFEFEALPSGKINYKPTTFEYLGKAAFFWTSTNQDNRYAWFRLMNDRSEVYSGHLFKKEAISVRCLKD